MCLFLNDNLGCLETPMHPHYNKERLTPWQVVLEGVRKMTSVQEAQYKIISAKKNEDLKHALFIMYQKLLGLPECDL